ncbi:MAG: hypothetical protein ACREEM_54470 [Blastocatellia bacterium]
MKCGIKSQRPRRWWALGLLTLCLSASAFQSVAAQTRTVRVINVTAAPGATASVAIELAAQGNENSAGFSLTFNPAVLSNPQAALGSGATGATLNANANQAAQGRFGVALALPTGQAFAAGARQLVVVTFAVASGAAAGATPIGFSDQPIVREVAGVNANALPADFVAGAVTVAGALASVSAASFTGTMLAAESIASAFGAKLATTTQVAASLPLPTTLAGTTVRVRDGAGTERLAPLFFVSPGQINYLLPAGVAAGQAAVTATSGDGSISIGAIQAAAVAPGLFAANANGQGVAAAVALRVRGEAQTFEPVAQFDSAQNRFVPLPIDLGPEGDQVFLIPYGTGFRNRSALSAVSVKVGGTDVTVLFAGAAPGFVGLDQINLGPLPRSLAGRGEVDLVLTVDGKAANTAKIAIK